jgi:hypothetical protein
VQARVDRGDFGDGDAGPDSRFAAASLPEFGVRAGATNGEPQFTFAGAEFAAAPGAAVDDA